MLPEQLEAAAGKAVSASEGQLSVRVDHAQAVWLAQGRDAAAAKLAQVREISPNGDLLRCSIAEAYLRMGLPAEALETTKGLTSARATALRIQATLDGVGKDEYLAAVAEAVGNESLKDHPSIVFWDLQQKLEGAEFDKVLGGADAVIETAGDWTAEIADLRAKAQNAMGSRGDADRSLLAAAKSARTRVGYDEEWQAKLALIRLNLRRGGNFLFKAVGVTLDMYKLGVKDAELSYSYAIANIRQGNERGAMKYLREAIELDPSFIPPFTQLNLMGKLEDDQAKLLQRTRPGAVLE
jgi:tetratricopeptide (TPR) repeat protein